MSTYPYTFLMPSKYERAIKQLSRWTHVWEEDTQALKLECEKLGLETFEEDDFIYITGKVVLEGERVDFETAVEIKY